MSVGGLGHLAIQVAAKIGCRVVALCGSNSKRDQAMQLGAHQFLAMNSEVGKGSQDGWPITRILVTTSEQPDWASILPCTATRSKIYPLSVSEGNLVYPYLPLILQDLTVHGLFVASRSLHREMLAFAARMVSGQ